jgi:diaminohydroxyphosphoribosylaminopyrimidine deaminase / 5-amino-6-(5-phosphoribosylamino)uracil reductase
MLTDAEYMERALLHAGRGRGRTSPNPIVGALVVSDGVVVSWGFHERAGEAHAEVRALNAAGPRARGATLYSTLEPCCHTGRTGPCTERIIDAGIRRVVAAVRDPNPRVAGGGFAALRARGIEVVDGVLQEAASRANQSFFTWVREGRPHVTMKIALSRDGRVAAARGTRTAITGPASDRQVHRDRAEIDAIGVGSGTVLIDDPELTARGAWRERPLTRVVFDRTLRTPPTARLFSTLKAGPVIVCTLSNAVDGGAAEALTRAGAQLEAIHGDFLPGALRRLGELGVTSLILEGGPALHGSLWRACLVDRVQLYIGQHALGDDGVPWLDATTFPLSALAKVGTRWLGGDLLIEGDVYRTH